VPLSDYLPPISMIRRQPSADRRSGVDPAYIAPGSPIHEAWVKVGGTRTKPAPK
jgi:hypothetical protein